MTALDLLTTLVGRSLVVSDGRDRYRLLDTLRAFARSRLADGAHGLDLGLAERRLAAWIRTVVIACDPYSHGPLPDAWPRVRLDLPSIRAALEWAFGPEGDRPTGARIVGALAGTLALSGEFAEASRWLTLAAGVDSDDETMATVLRGVAVVDLYQGRFDEALRAAERAHEHATRTGVEELVASCAITFGSAAWGLGELGRSSALLRDAAATFDRVGDVRGRGFALARLARTLSDLADPDAVETATAAVDDLEASQDDWVGVVALDHLAYALLATGDHRAAAVRAEQAITLAERIGSFSGHLGALSLLGRIRLAEGDLGAARDVQQRVVTAALRVRNLGAVTDGLDGLADVFIAAGQHALAAMAAGAADSMRRRSGVVVTRRRATRAEARLALLGAELGPEALDDRLRAGRSLTPLDALALAPS
ncbi:MAG: tetratricopeptide repeat protein [Actinobacteria bacterium]|nr:tetratricopeptide repeat protein [Actinomycetota bacterium]